MRARCIVCKYLVSLTLVAGVSPVVAEVAGCSGEKYRHFDFWLGDWDVHTAQGELAGYNRVTRDQAGCLLIENWRGSQGGIGTSFNFYDPVDDRWRQVWVAPGTHIEISGQITDGSMVLEGFITYLRTAQRFAFRGTWTLQEDGRVRQFFEKSREQGEWKPWFEGFYSRGHRSD